MYPFIQNIRSTYDYVYFYFYFWRVFKLSILSPVAFEFFKFSTIIHLRSSVVWCGLVWSHLVWSRPVRFGPVFSGSVRFCPVRSGPVQSGPFRSGLVRSLVRLGSVCSGRFQSGLVRSGPVHSGRVCGPGHSRQVRTGLPGSCLSRSSRDWQCPVTTHVLFPCSTTTTTLYTVLFGQRSRTVKYRQQDS
jgi:hypothetical protein